MAISSVCKAVITTSAVVSIALLGVSCSRSDSQQASGDSQSAIAAENIAAETEAEDVPKRVSTNHDIFHSKTLEVPTGTPVPAISIQTEDDPVNGWNLYVGTANFTFEPTKVNGESIPTEGHANLYINDKHIQRIYGTWTHLPTLPGGKNEIRVTLNANGYETLTTQDEPIEDSVTVDVYEPNLDPAQ